MLPPPLTFCNQSLCQVQLQSNQITQIHDLPSDSHTLITLTGAPKVEELANHTFCISLASTDDNDDSFITLDEVSVIRRAVTCLVITINKAVRHYRDPIEPLLNHCMGVKGGAAEMD